MSEGGSRPAKVVPADEVPVDVAMELPFHLLQTLRLAQAIGEAGFRICVPPGDEVKVVTLKKVFGFDYKVGTAGASRIAGLSVDHMTPRTAVGAIERPLIMPQAIFDHCRARWPERRDVDVSFAGILTETRRAALNDWLRLSGLEQLAMPPKPSFLRRVLRRLARTAGVSLAEQVGTENVKLYLSDQGRLFPRKSWNADYYDLLLRSKFVLCPSGDFKANGVAWTYRFFEAVLCGAIPVIEESCAAYEGYRVRSMSDPVGALDWSRADAEHNVALARRRLTVAPQELRAEVLGLLRAPGAAPGAAPAAGEGVYAT
ncbi:MAG: hypothetical protein ACM35H_12780 [Bacteroidota bacterium]|nr:hypothetical protein [Kiloniellaceae bacterium]